VLAWLALLYCLLAGAGNTADCLSEEKREGTLGLLFLTDLKGYDVVLGKLLATSLNSFYALIAIFPPLAVTICLGGVTGGEFWRLVLLLVSSMFLSLAIGMFVSALSRDEQRAWGGALALLLVLAAGPVLGLLSVFDAKYKLAPGVFWQSLLGIHLASGVMLALASAILPRAWQDRPLSARSLWTRWLGAFARRARARELRPQNEALANPVLWLAGRQVTQVSAYLWALIVSLSAAGLIAYVFALRSSSMMWALCTGALTLHYLLAVWAAFQASHVFAEARTSGTLELLLCTPLAADQIVEGYFAGLKRVFVRPITTLLGIESAMLAGGLVYLGWHDRDSFLGAPLLLGPGFFMLLFVSDLFAVGRFGMWMALSSKKPGQAFVKTVVFVMVLPLFAFCCTIFMPVVWVFKNAFLINFANERLQRHFRTVLTEGAIEKKRLMQLPSVLEDGTWGNEQRG